MCEVGLVLNELSYIRKRTHRWARDKRVPTPLSQFKSVSFRHPEPYGVVLVMAPWNYPFMLAMEPVVGAIAAGNCVVMKPSAYSPATSAVMAKLVAALASSCHPAVIAATLSVSDLPFNGCLTAASEFA